VPIKSALERWRSTIQATKNLLSIDIQSWLDGTDSSADVLSDIRALESSGCPNNSIRNQMTILENLVMNAGAGDLSSSELANIDNAFNNLFGQL